MAFNPNWHFAAFSNIFIRDICTTFGTPNLLQSPDIGQNSDGISDFRISGHSLIKENWKLKNKWWDIDMKLGQVNKLDKGNKTNSKKVGNDFMLANCDVIVNFLIYGQFGAIQKPVSRL